MPLLKGASGADLSPPLTSVGQAWQGGAQMNDISAGESGAGTASAEASAGVAGAVAGGAGERRISVFLVDDHEIVRRGLRDLLEAEPDMKVIGEAGTAVSAVHRMPALRPDVAVLDVRLPDGDGVSVCREIRSALPGTACLMLTSHGDDQALLGAIMAGAAGYVLKQTCGSELVSAVRTVAAGGSMLDAHAAQRVMERLRERMASVDPLSALTEQEKRVLELIGEGLTNRQISERMVLSEKTAKNYVSSVLTKLGMQRRAQAAAFAARLADSHAD
jgi:DNA-binding NarL/FixJ family response regulator